MIGILFGLLVVAAAAAVPARAQQAVRIDLPPGAGVRSLGATFYRAAGAAPSPAVVLLHGCGGVGQNLVRMAQHLASQGYAALLPDSFGARAIRDACTRNWPTLADAERRAGDIDAALSWLQAHAGILGDRLAVMGYSYGGGVLLLRALQADRPPLWRAAIAVYPDCALADHADAKLSVSRPLLMALAERDDWTPIWQCRTLVGHVGSGRDLIETREYAGAQHSFDAVGLPVQYLATAGNRSKPNNCCGAHYGFHEPAWRQFVNDVDEFLGRKLR